MPTIRFYQQQRNDGGLRSGLGIDEEPVLHEYVAGGRDSDPALLWYVDVVATSNILTSDPELARDWLTQHGKPIKHTLRSLADRLEIGLDETANWPYSASVSHLPRGTTGQVSVSAVRRLRDGELAGHLRALADDWEGVLARLTPLASVRS